MAGDKFLYNNSGVVTEKASVQTTAGAGDAGKIPALNSSGVLDLGIVNAKTSSAGAGDANKVVALDSTGRIDNSMMPVGVGAETMIIPATENLSAGHFVNIWNNSGNAGVRRADASTSGKEANGFVLSAFANGANATVYFPSQTNTQLSGMTPGAVQFLSDSSPGAVTENCPSGSGKTVQILGRAGSATAMVLAPREPIVLA